MFTQQTTRSLAPKSWWTVGAWIILAGVIITHPVDSGRVFFGFVIGASRWAGYTAFADCDDPPPMEWMEPKPCATTNAEPELEEPTDPPSSGSDSTTAANGDDGYTITVDSNAIRSVLDEGTDAVVALHDEVTEIQSNDGVTVELGDQHGR